ncbi:hypothetical protein FCV25MIE_16637, partial [Fagus crenata]
MTSILYNFKYGMILSFSSGRFLSMLTTQKPLKVAKPWYSLPSTEKLSVKEDKKQVAAQNAMRKQSIWMFDDVMVDAVPMVVVVKGLSHGSVVIV